MPNCKYIKEQEIVSYNGGTDWQDVMPAQYRKGQLIEHGSEDCSEIDTLYRWRKLSGVYLCVDDTKYEKLILDESYDGGLSWYPAYPSQYTTGNAVGVDEDYCNDKFVGHYLLTGGGDGRCPQWYRWNGFRCVYVDPIKVVKCDGNTELTSADTAYYHSIYYNFSLFNAEIGKCVTSISANTFANNRVLTYVSMADSVTSIGNYAFGGCYSLSGMNTTIPGELNIPSGVTSIGGTAFQNCRSLTEVNIPNSVTNIGIRAFADCTGLTSVIISNGVTSIGDRAFSGCTGLTSIVSKPTTPPSLGGSYVFYNTNNCPIYVPCESFLVYRESWSSLINRLYPIGGESCIPTKVKYDYDVRSRTYYCDGDTIIDSGDTDGIGVERSAITGVYIGSCATAIDNSAFSNCGFSAITIPSGVTSIGSYAFSGCTSLTSCTIENGVTSIGDYAFWKCSGLTSVAMSDSVTSIGDYAFWNCTSLPVEGYIRYADTYAIEATDKSLTSYTLKNNTRWIGLRAFQWCSSLTSMVIPDTVVYIQANAFDGCSAMTSCTIGNNLTSIGGYAFINCSSLTSINIPDNVTSIGQAAFMDCSGLTSIVIPDSVTSIGNYAFSNCRGLTSFTVKATTPPTLGSSAFNNTNNCPIYVPSGSVNTYKSTSGWIPYASRIQAIPPAGSMKWLATYQDSHTESAECDASSAITQNEITKTSLVSVVIGDCITYVDTSTFSRCYSLTSVVIGTGLTRIYGYAFENCTGLTSVTIEATTPPRLGSLVFNNTNDCPIYVPSGSVNAYKADSYWSIYSSRIRAIT